MNKFEKAQEVLRELGGDGWLIICVEANDINSRFMLGVESPYARSRISLSSLYICCGRWKS